jgi:arginine N-succinyltransferase
VAQASHAADKRFDLDALVLTNEFVGYTEVGTLFLKPSFRGGGAGRLAAQSRYLLMAAAPERFGEMVLAELRGVVSEDGETPFWDAIGKHFFRMSFADADKLSATSDNQFILDLMPKYPIYIDLLPPEAREVIGRCHADGVGAMKLLEWEGFRFERTVDIFDGGPSVSAKVKDIRAVRESKVLRTGVSQKTPEPDYNDKQGLLLVSNRQYSDYRVLLVNEKAAGDDTLWLTQQQADILQLNEGDLLRAVSLRPRVSE